MDKPRIYSFGTKEDRWWMCEGGFVMAHGRTPSLAYMSWKMQESERLLARVRKAAGV